MGTLSDQHKGRGYFLSFVKDKKMTLLNRKLDQKNSLSTYWLRLVISVKKVGAWRKNITQRERKRDLSVRKSFTGAARQRERLEKNREALHFTSLDTSDLSSQL